jgi:hypothetical protein
MKNMKKTRVKSKIFTIAAILVLTFSALVITLPTTSAQEVTRETYPYINAVPNPVGVNQEVLLHIGITHPLALQWLGWEGLSVTATDPNGDTYTLFEDIRTDSTGGTGRVFVPTIVGNWHLQTHFPEQKNPVTTTPGGGTSNDPTFPSTPANATMLASDSEVLTLVVQSEPVPDYPGVPLPTEYWERPIDAQLREWSTISGSWLMVDGDTGRASPLLPPRNLYAPYNDGPETAHILWIKPHDIGGIVGGEPNGLSFELGDAYSGKWGRRMIVAGVLIYNQHGTGFFGDTAEHTMVAIDVHTGEELWSKVIGTGETLGFSQLMYWDTFDMHGALAYVWTTAGSTWHAYDVFTGRLEYTLEGVPSGIQAYGPKGEILIYQVNTEAGWMALWNSTAIPALYGAEDLNDTSNFFYFLYAAWYPWGKTVNATGPTFVRPNNPLGKQGYSWNVTIPANLPGSVQAVFDDRIIGAEYDATHVTSWAISTAPGHEGTVIYGPKTWNAPTAWIAGNQTIFFEAASDQGEDGVFVLGAREARRHYGFSAETGDFLWETDPEIYLNWYGVPSERPEVIAYGKLFAAGIGGTVYAYDITDGSTAWTYNATDPYNEFLFNINWWAYPLFITDGKIYYGHLEHSPIDPRPRGGPFFCLDVETGNEIFRIDGAFRQSLWGGKALIGDSIIVTQDTYDQRVYAIGKGPTATTVTAPDVGVTKGSPLMIKGTVTDISSGTEDSAVAKRFPNGVPAIADEDMSDWMLYVYKNFPLPMDISGVTVTIDAYAPDGTYTNLGTVESDGSGMFKMMWTPDQEGEYTIITTFMGSKSYWPSYAQTAVAVGPAPSPTIPIEPEQGPLITTEVAIIIAIAVIAGLAIIAYVILKKR